MPTDIAIRDLTAVRELVRPAPLGLTFFLYHDVSAPDHDLYVTLTHNVESADPDAGTLGYFTDAFIFADLNYSAVFPHAFVGLITHPCPVHGIILRVGRFGEWPIAPMEVYKPSTWHPGPLKLYHNGEWLDVETLPT